MDKPLSVLEMRTRAMPSIAPAAIRTQDEVSGSLFLRAQKLGYAEAALEMLKDHPVLATMSAKGRRDYLSAEIHALRHSRDLKLKREIREHDKKLAKVEIDRAALDELIEWLMGDLKLECPEGVSFRRLRKAVAEGEALGLDRPHKHQEPRDWEKEIFCNSEILVVEHDWSAALQGAAASDAQYILPFEVCAFEFRISGHNVIAFAVQADSDVLFTVVVESKVGWYFVGKTIPLESGQMDANELHGLLTLQIRSLCIALDAEVAEAAVTRETHSGLTGKNHRASVRPYHIVKLSHRAARPLPRDSEPTGRRVRLHFRRGHWRHFETHKTWIKWMLVGDPDLGFIDKHYKC